MSGRLKMLSSQPKRSWGDSDDENERPEFTLNSEDWPPTPPKARPGKANVVPAVPKSTLDKGKAVARSASSTGIKTGSVNSSSSTSGWATASTGRSTATARPLVSRKSEPVQSLRPVVDVPLAPLFSRQRPASSAGSSSRAMASGSTSSSRIATGSASFAFNNPAKAASTGSVLPAKRTLPWEELESQASNKSRPGQGNFHELRAPGGSGQRIGGKMKEELLRSSTMDIKQKLVLSPEQQSVLRMVVEDGDNVFFTGSAGTGKSVLLREIIASLKRKYRRSGDAVAVTASTGMAACNIGGTTIHSFASIGLGLGEPEQLVASIRRNKTAVSRWQRCKVLVIDEVSMVDGNLFDKLARIAQIIRKKSGSKAPLDKPFGGIQLVITGDFFQLPPVTKGQKAPRFAFEADNWSKCIKHTVNLTQVFRQKDTRFIDMLNEMRFGELSEESIKTFRTLSRTPTLNGIEPTELFPMRNEVERANSARLQALKGELKSYKAEDSVAGQNDPSALQKNTYLQNFMAVETLHLKVGAQVMLIKNLDTELVNGTIGRVVGFWLPGSGPDDLDDEEFGEQWETGPNGEQRPRAGSAGPDRKTSKLVQAIARGEGELPPIIDWQTPAGIVRKSMAREEFKVEDTQGRKLASRKQYPVILAWAMSIHKSQGQTIPCVKVDLGRVFEKGQSYVALSRATSLDGLQVLNFAPNKVNAHQTVVDWSKNLQVIQTS